MIALEHVVAGVDDFTLGPITFSLKSGEHGMVIGPSGAGKSLLIEVIAGLRPVQKGRIFIGDKEATRWPTHQRKLGWVPQFHTLFPHLTVRENLAFAMRIAKTSRSDIDKAIENMSARLDLPPLLHKRPGHLSGGERQRVALGRALLSRCKVLVLDEAFSSLHQPMRSETRNWVLQTVLEDHLTVIEVSHDESTIAHHPGPIFDISQGKYNAHHQT